MSKKIKKIKLGLRLDQRKRLKNDFVSSLPTTQLKNRIKNLENKKRVVLDHLKRLLISTPIPPKENRFLTPLRPFKPQKTICEKRYDRHKAIMRYTNGKGLKVKKAVWNENSKIRCK